MCSHHKSGPKIEKLQTNLRLPSRKRGSVPFSRFSRRRLEFEARVKEDEAKAVFEGEQQELELRCKQREMEMMNAQNETMELAERIVAKYGKEEDHGSMFI